MEKHQMISEKTYHIILKMDNPGSHTNEPFIAHLMGRFLGWYAWTDRGNEVQTLEQVENPDANTPDSALAYFDFGHLSPCRCWQIMCPAQE